MAAENGLILAVLSRILSAEEAATTDFIALRRRVWQHGAAGGTRVRANTSMLVLVHGPGSGSAALAAESLLNTGKCRCDAGKVYVRCLCRR